MDEISLTGKVVIVTGAGRGLGRAMALGLAEAGTGVTVNSLIPGGASDTPFVTPSVRGTRTLLPPEIMIPPILWLASGFSDGMTGGRYVGKNWDPGLAPAKAAARAREAPVFLKP